MGFRAVLCSVSIVFLIQIVQIIQIVQKIFQPYTILKTIIQGFRKDISIFKIDTPQSVNKFT